MARSYLSGAEFNSSGEPSSVTGTVGTSAGLGSGYCYTFGYNGAAENYATFTSRATTGTLRALFRSVRFYLNFNQDPSSSGITFVLSIGSSADADAVMGIGTGGVVYAQSYGGQSSSFPWGMTAGTWYRIEVDVGYSTDSGVKVYVDGTLRATAAGGTAFSVFTSASIGNLTTHSGTSGTLKIDHILFDDASFSTSGLPGAGQQVLLLPSSDNTDGTWTAGAGGASLYPAVDNVPPIGDATPTDSTQITNVSKTGNQDVTLNMQSYSTGTVPTGATVNAVMAIASTGEQVGTGTKDGGIWIASNPAQSAGGNSFDFGNDAGALGDYPTNWSTNAGPVSVAPSVTLGTSPTLTIRKVVASSRATDVCFAGIYVDYTPATVQLKSMNAILLASIKSVNSVAIASVKKVNALTTT